MQFAMLPLQGLTQGSQPIVSFNFGAGNVKRVRQAFRLLLISCVCYSTLLWLVCMLFPQWLASAFSSDTALIAYTAPALRIYMACSLLFGLQIACQQTFIAIGNAQDLPFSCRASQADFTYPAHIHFTRAAGGQNCSRLSGRACGGYAGRHHNRIHVFYPVPPRTEADGKAKIKKSAFSFASQRYC